MAAPDKYITHIAPDATGDQYHIVSLAVTDGNYLILPPTLTQNEVIATISDVPTSADYVDLESNQDVDGHKSFSTRPSLKVSGNVPEGYQQIEYITFDSSSYVDTGIVLTDTSNLTSILDASYAGASASFCTLWGFMNSTQQVTPRCAVNIYNSKYMIGVNSTVSSASNYLTGRHTIKFFVSGSTQTLTVDGTDMVSTTFSQDGMSGNTRPCYISARNTGGSANNFSSLVLYSFYLSAGGVSYKFLPCKRLSDNAIGIYDVINGTFKAATGNVAAGPQITDSDFLVEADLAPVALTGSYNDLADKPTLVEDVRVNNTSIVSNKVANLVTNTAYNASSNKIATMSDLPTASDFSDDFVQKGAVNTVTGATTLSGNVANPLVLKRTGSSTDGTFIDYYPNNQNSQYMRVGVYSTGNWGPSVDGSVNSSLTVNRNRDLVKDNSYTITIQNKSGTMALLSDIPTDIPEKDSDLTNDSYVSYAGAQTLTDTQKATARTNIGLGAAATKAVDTTVTSGSSNLITSGAVFTAIDNLPEPMVFKGTLGSSGTITTLPTAAAANEGYTYKVITAGTYSGIVAKVGDVFVSAKTGTSIYEWVLIPAGDTDSDTWRNIKINGTELLGSAVSTGAVNFKNGTNITITGSGNDITINGPTVNDGKLTIQGEGTAAAEFTANQSGNTTLNIKGSGATTVTRSAAGEITISSTDNNDNDNQTVKGNGTAFGANDAVDIVGSGIVGVAADTTNKKITISASHQSIKTLKTDNTTAQSTSTSEAIAGSGTINLHKVAKTGTYSDLIDTPTVDAAVNMTSTNAVQNKAIAAYIAARGENLLTNGTAYLQNNYNFSGLTFDGSDTYYAGGCFKHTGGRLQTNTNELMPVDVSQTYEITYYARSSSATSTLYDFLLMYDSDKLAISAKHVMWMSGSTTTLAQDLVTGATKVYLTSTTGFTKTSTEDYRRGLIFWNYQNSAGYQYATETYSRNVYTKLWTNSSAFNDSENSISLTSAWTGPTIPAGTSVSQSNDGAVYTYMNSGALGTTQWKQRVGTMSGVGKNNAGGKFREGTAFVQLGWLIDQNSESNVTWKLSTISVAKKIDNNNQRIKTTNSGTTTTFGANDTIDLVAGNNITLTPQTTGSGAPKVTIASTDTDTYREIKVNGTTLLGTATSTGYVNFNPATGSHIDLTGSGHDVTVGVASGYSIPSDTKQDSWDKKLTQLTSSTDNAIVRFNGTTGNIQDSVPQIDDNGNITTTKSIYLNTISGSIGDTNSSRLYFGTAASPISWLASNTSGAFSLATSNGSFTFYANTSNYNTLMNNCGADLGRNDSDGTKAWGDFYTKGSIYKHTGSAYVKLDLPTTAGTLALTSAIPTESTVSGWGFTKNIGTVTSVASEGRTISPDNTGAVDLNNTFYTTTAPTANAFEVSIPGITALTTGLVIHVKFHAATASGATLKVNNLDAKPLYYRTATAITTHIVADNYVTLIYDGTNWVMQYAYDSSGSNSVGYQIRTNSSLWANKTGYAMNRYSLFFEVDGGLSGAATTIKTATNKVTVNFKYIPGGVIKYYSTSGSIAVDADFAAAGLWDQYVCDLRYTFNCGSTLEAGKPVYVKMSVNTDGTLSPVYSGSPAHPIVQSLPTTADGYVYLYLGQAYSTTNLELYNNHPIYEYQDGKIKPWTPITSTSVTNALGYTPYSAANPNNYTSVVESTVSGWGFTKNTGTVTSVDSVAPTSGDVALSAVRYVSQSLTDAQKTQARTNIGALASTDFKRINSTYTDSMAMYADEMLTGSGVIALNAIAKTGQETYLLWGGRNLVGGIGPVAMAMSSEHNANRLAFIDGNALTFEYTDDGEHWTDCGLTQQQKSWFCTSAQPIRIGNPASSLVAGQSKTRVTLTAQSGEGQNGQMYVYTLARKILINVSTAAKMMVLIEYRRGTEVLSGGAWTEYGTFQLAGWSGWNDIPFNKGSFGGGKGQTGQIWQIRFTFIADEVNPSYPTTCQVHGIRLFGDTNWMTPSNMANTGHIYSYNVWQDVTFPAQITTSYTINAGTFKEGGTALSAKYLGISAKAADADKLDGNDSTAFEFINNKITTLTASSTDVQYPSAKVVYDNLPKIRKYI